MPTQIVIEALKGEKIGQTIRVVIQIEGEPGELTREGEAVRFTMCHELASAITSAAQRDGYWLVPVDAPMNRTVQSF